MDIMPQQNNLDGACAEIVEGLGQGTIKICVQCASAPQLVRCLISIDGDSYYKFFVVCRCNAGMPAHSRKAAIDNWQEDKFYSDKKIK